MPAIERSPSAKRAALLQSQPEGSTDLFTQTYSTYSKIVSQL